jgi:hypothetical protein
MISLARWLFAVLFLLVVIGVFRGWFSFSNFKQDQQAEQVNFSVSVDTGKVKDDARRAEEFTESVAERIRNSPDTAQGQNMR